MCNSKGVNVVFEWFTVKATPFFMDKQFKFKKVIVDNTRLFATNVIQKIIKRRNVYSATNTISAILSKHSIPCFG